MFCTRITNATYTVENLTSSLNDLKIRRRDALKYTGAVGRGHSSSGLVSTDETLLTMSRFSCIQHINRETKEVAISQFSERAGTAISIHNFHDKPYQGCFTEMEQIFDRYRERPHWGKLHTKVGEDFAAIHPRWEEFSRVRNQLDLNRRFINRHLTSLSSAQ